MAEPNWRMEGDADADDVVAEYMRNRPVSDLKDLLGDLFRWGLPGAKKRADLPPEILAFLKRRVPHPAWFPEDDQRCWARVARAQALYTQFERPTMVVLGCASLPHCYAYGDVAAALIMSGRLASQVRIRLGETANFVDTMMRDGALRVDGNKPGAGLLWARKVRMIHAVMRALILVDPAQDQPRPDGRADGRVGDALVRREWVHDDRQPINQLELALVLLTFSLVVVDGLRALKAPVTEQDAEDYLFTWAFVGYQLGIKEALLQRCMTLREARNLIAEIEASQRGIRLEAEVLVLRQSEGKASWLPATRAEKAAVETVKAAEAGRLLSAALLVLLRDRAVQTLRGWDWITKSLAQSLVRHLVGETTADDLWVEPAPLLPRILHWLAIKTGYVVKLGENMEETFRRDAPSILPAGDIADFALPGLPVMPGHPDKT